MYVNNEIADNIKMLKKKKRGEKEKKEKKVRKKCLNERETLSYEQQILDNNRQLSRFVY